MALSLENLNDDDWYLVHALNRRITNSRADRPHDLEPYPNFTWYTGSQIRLRGLEINWAPAQAGCAPTAIKNVAPGDYQGHASDGSSVQKHSCGPLYPYVIFAQETLTGIRHGVIGPAKPNGILVGSYGEAVEYAVKLKAKNV